MAITKKSKLAPEAKTPKGAEVLKTVRKLRHWKQQFDKNAAFVWRKSVNWAGEMTIPGTGIPEELFTNKYKLRTFWEANVIELLEFKGPVDYSTGFTAETPIAKTQPKKAKAKKKQKRKEDPPEKIVEVETEMPAQETETETETEQETETETETPSAQDDFAEDAKEE